MSNKVPYLANGISFKVTKKRFQMMMKRSSLKMKSFKLGLIFPILASVLLTYCIEVEKEQDSIPSVSINLDYTKPTDPAELPAAIENKGGAFKKLAGNMDLSTNRQIYVDTVLYEEFDDRTRFDYYHKTFNEDGILFTGTQNAYYKINDRLIETKQFEDGLLIESVSYYGNGTEKFRYQYEYFPDKKFTKNYVGGVYQQTVESIPDVDGKGFTYKTLDDGNLSRGSWKLNEDYSPKEIKHYDENGSLSLHEYFEDGLYYSKSYYPSGQIRSERSSTKKYKGAFQIELPKLHGVQTTYNEDGTILSKRVYENGELIETIK